MVHSAPRGRWPRAMAKLWCSCRASTPSPKGIATAAGPVAGMSAIPKLVATGGMSKMTAWTATISQVGVGRGTFMWSSGGGRVGSVAAQLDLDPVGVVGDRDGHHGPVRLAVQESDQVASQRSPRGLIEMVGQVARRDDQAGLDARRRQQRDRGLHLAAEGGLLVMRDHP